MENYILVSSPFVLSFLVKMDNFMWWFLYLCSKILSFWVAFLLSKEFEFSPFFYKTTDNKFKDRVIEDLNLKFLVSSINLLRLGQAYTLIQLFFHLSMLCILFKRKVGRRKHFHKYSTFLLVLYDMKDIFF